MIQINDKSKCNGCTACEQICGHHAISMKYDEYGQLYPQISIDNCTNCGLCEKVCPMLHTELLPDDKDLSSIVVKAVYNSDEKVRMRSTSGGMFSVLAEYIIEIGGIVCAARFDDQYHIHHSFFGDIADIDPYRGSKYAQSDLRDCFRQIKKYLKSRPVLFVGTPCQVVGLKFFLQKEYSNLYTCDFICMSISSGKMWDEYIESYQKNHIIKRIFFKDKRFGWHKTDWRMLIEDENGEHLMEGSQNEYFRCYLLHLSARPSCFNCAVRHCQHLSDITISDCWGIEQVHPNFDDNKGCTTLILQSQKGEEIFCNIKDKLKFIDYSIDYVRKYNRHIEKQAIKPIKYESFCMDYQKYGFIVASHNICSKLSFYKRFKKKLHDIFF